jgi:imidazolonepropionase-like amidohydrolase
MPPATPPPPDETARVTAFWRELGLPGLVDVHTHFMPEPMLAKVWAYFDAVGHAGVQGARAGRRVRAR